MYWRGKSILLHILKPLGLVILKHVPEKKTWKEVAEILDELNSLAKLKGFQIEKAFTDPEGNFVVAKGKTLLDIDTTGPRLHQEDEERCVRTVNFKTSFFDCTSSSKTN